jgi:hypothetical protein
VALCARHQAEAQQNGVAGKGQDNKYSTDAHTMAVFLVFVQRKFFRFWCVPSAAEKLHETDDSNSMEKLGTPADGIAARYGHIPPVLRQDMNMQRQNEWTQSAGLVPAC